MKLKKIAYKTLLASMAAAVLALSGCGGGGGSDETAEVYSCTLLEYDKSSLPAEPQSSFFDGNPLYRQQWAIHYDSTFYRDKQIDPEAHIHPQSGNHYLGRGVKVAIIDNGLDTTHEDLAGAVVASYDVKTGTTDVMPPSDEFTHGTEVTGVIGARDNSLGIVGVAPEAEIYFIRLPFEDVVTTDHIMRAFEKVKEWDVDIVSCSWGSSEVSDSVAAAIETLATEGRGGKGTVIVFAVGNCDTQIGDDESGLPWVIGVGATNKDNRRAYYSNYGTQLDVMAPGGEFYGITTLDQMGDRGLATKQPNYIEYNDYVNYGDVSIPFRGTSASTPIVAGVVAQLLEANPSLTREQVYNALVCSADKIGTIPYGEDGFNIYYGYGKVNASKALELVR